MLPSHLKLRADQYAKKKRISLGELMRNALETLLDRPSAPIAEDTFFADTRVFRGPVPADTSKNHDDYLYGDKR